MKVVLAAATMGAAQAFVAPTAFSGTSLSSARVTSTSTPRMSLAEYKEELAETAKKIASPGQWFLRVLYTLYQWRLPRFNENWVLVT